MTVLYFIRHAHHDLLGRELVGRRAGVYLSAKGLEQSVALGMKLARVPLDRVLSSPSERCRQTAAPIAERQGRVVEIAAELDEIDFGDWTGRHFAKLEHEPEWQRFNHARSRAAIPGGERMIDVEARGVDLVENTAARCPRGRIALTSHGDVIRAILIHYLGMPLDFIHRLHVPPASVSLLAIGERDCMVLGINIDTELLEVEGTGT